MGPPSLQLTGSPSLGLPAAVPATGADDGVAWHFGNPLAEQRAAEQGAALVDRSHRGVVAVSGPQRLGWLHTLTSQHLSALAPLTPTEALLLSPHGHVEHHLQVLDDGTRTLLGVEPGTQAALVDHLAKMVFWSEVEPVDATAAIAVLTVLGPQAPAVLAAVGLPAPETAALAEAGPIASTTGVLVRRRRSPLAQTYDLLVPRTQAADLAAALVAAGASPAGTWAYEALRVAAREPRLGAESDHRTIPNELGWLSSAVHLDKGCYRGQETVARVHNLGRPPRRLVLLHVDGTEVDLPKHGAAITLAGKQVGSVGTAALHHELGPVVLALLKRTVADDAELVIVTDSGSVSAAADAG